MAGYVDGFVIPIPKKSLKYYQSIAKKACKVWKDHGAIDYYECVGDDLKPKGVVNVFPKAMKCKPGEVVFFSFIIYKSRAHRDKVNAKVMKDPRLAKMMDPKKPMPFDMKRFSYGGFKVIVKG